MAVTMPSFKRGDSWSLTCVYKRDTVAQDLTGFTIKSQIRQTNGQLVDDLVANITDQWVTPGGFVLVPSKGSNSTLPWPLGNLNIDILFINDSGAIISTETFVIPVVETITQP